MLLLLLLFELLIESNRRLLLLRLMSRPRSCHWRSALLEGILLLILIDSTAVVLSLFVKRGTSRGKRKLLLLSR